MKRRLLFPVFNFLIVSQVIALDPHMATAPPHEEDVQVEWVQLGNVFLEEDSPTQDKITYIKSHNYPIYKEFIKVIAGQSENGWIARQNLNATVQRFYDEVSLMLYADIPDGIATFDGKLAIIKNNELAYQELLADLAEHTKNGYILREYAQRKVTEVYWRLRFSAWYATAALYGNSALTATKNFWNTTITPRLTSMWGVTRGWASEKRAQLSDWYRKTRGQSAQK